MQHTSCALCSASRTISGAGDKANFAKAHAREIPDSELDKHIEETLHRPGWRSFFDPNRQLYYFQDTVTQKVQWEHPKLDKCISRSIAKQLLQEQEIRAANRLLVANWRPAPGDGGASPMGMPNAVHGAMPGQEPASDGGAEPGEAG